MFRRSASDGGMLGQNACPPSRRDKTPKAMSGALPAEGPLRNSAHSCNILSGSADDAAYSSNGVRAGTLTTDGRNAASIALFGTTGRHALLDHGAAKKMGHNLLHDP
jgi:hypothetical protein